MKCHWIIRLSCKIFLLSSSLLLGESASALPFSPDPISFSGYLSFVDWGDPSLKIRFEHLGRCSYNVDAGLEKYQCDSGYAVIKDALSSQKCRVRTWYDGYSAYYIKDECRSLKIVEKVRPPTPAPRSVYDRVNGAFQSIFGR